MTSAQLGRTAIATTAMAAGKQSTVMLTEPIPVLIFYTTAIVDVDGKTRFASDIYGLDARLEEALRTR